MSPLQSDWGEVVLTVLIASATASPESATRSAREELQFPHTSSSNNVCSSYSLWLSLVLEAAHVSSLEARVVSEAGRVL